MLKDGHKSIGDILKEISEEEDIKISQVKLLWNHQREFLMKTMDRDDCYNIQIPFIGNLYVNIKQFKVEKKGQNRETNKSFMQKVKYLKHIILQKKMKDKRYRSIHEMHSSVNKLCRYIVRTYHTRFDKPIGLLKAKDSYDMIQKYSNGGYEKREKHLLDQRYTNNSKNSHLK